MTIVEFLQARYDEDEAAAKRAGADNLVWQYDRERFEVFALGAWSIASRRASGPLCDVDGEHIARHDPARLLREVEAKRRILDDYERAHGYAQDPCCGRTVDRVIELLALPYADHPDYDPSWSPA